VEDVTQEMAETLVALRRTADYQSDRSTRFYDQSDTVLSSRTPFCWSTSSAVMASVLPTTVVTYVTYPRTLISNGESALKSSVSTNSHTGTVTSSFSFPFSESDRPDRIAALESRLRSAE